MIDTTPKLTTVFLLTLILGLAPGCNSYVINDDPQLDVKVDDYYPSAPIKQMTNNSRVDLCWTEFERP